MSKAIRLTESGAQKVGSDILGKERYRTNGRIVDVKPIEGGTIEVTVSHGYRDGWGSFVPTKQVTYFLKPTDIKEIVDDPAISDSHGDD